MSPKYRLINANFPRGNHRGEVLRRLLGKPDRRHCNGRLSSLFHPPREDQEDWEEGQFGGGGWPVDGCLTVDTRLLLGIVLDGGLDNRG